MKYQIIRTADQVVVAEAARVNDSYLIQQVQLCINYGCFEDGSAKLFRDGIEIDPDFVIEKDEKRYASWLAKKQQTHKLISVNTGVCCLPQNRKQIWVPK